MVTPAFRFIVLHVKPLFELGRILVTPAAATLIAARRIRVEVLLARHVTGDWGDAPSTLVSANRTALQSGGELMSIYIPTPESEVNSAFKERSIKPLWVVTDAERRATTFMTPGDY